MTKLTKCDLCDEIAAFEYLAEEKFVYGAGEDRAVLSATVEVTECRSCGEAYTGEHGEIQRALAVRMRSARLSNSRARQQSEFAVRKDH
ncbi:hypothetical protein OIU34_16895 [Pararhizobium sp. BT-229]|uniref:hypothetical protein n=1 Tax=Pararhizobium sp. BT-229 TaxID=2986923 RepID=UPI0021F7D140|nr:hypothetical protein [Pararhizobium sp. BT-229]MCV9963583.1 hypothetical protein [Pararhizobium sp. BT-229]